MATQNLKFIKVDTVPTSGLIVGGIYFETSTHLLKVATSATATEVYSGVRNVTYNTETEQLQFINPDGAYITITVGDGLTGSGSNTSETISHAIPSGASAKASGLYKVATDKFGHVISATAVTKADITGLDIPTKNTTYTFAGGTNKFTVTPSDGTAQDVPVTPSIENNVVKSSADTTEGYIPKFTDTAGTIANGYSVETTLTENASAIPTSSAVETAINNKIAAADAMIFKGTIGDSGTNTNVPASGYQTGWTYKVITAGTYAGIKCEVGDMLIALNDSTNSTITNSDWTVVQANIDGAVTGPASSTANNVAIFDGATGKVIKDSGITIEKSVPSNAVFTDDHVTAAANHYIPEDDGAGNASETSGNAVAAGGKVITAVKKDSRGHVIGVITGTIPDAQTLSGLGGVGSVTFTSSTLSAKATKTDTEVALTAELCWEQF